MFLFLCKPSWGSEVQFEICRHVRSLLGQRCSKRLQLLQVSGVAERCDDFLFKLDSRLAQNNDFHLSNVYITQGITSGAFMKFSFVCVCVCACKKPYTLVLLEQWNETWSFVIHNIHFQQKRSSEQSYVYADVPRFQFSVVDWAQSTN